MSLTAELKDYAQGIGIDEIKITTAEDLPEVKRFLKEMKGQEYLSKFVHNDLDLITTPQQVLAEAESIILCAISYKVAEEHIKQSKGRVKEDLRGQLSSFAWGRDYHQVLGERLDRLMDFLASKVDQFSGVKFVDTGPTVDRALAERAGIGWQGKNCSIIHPEYGSWIFLGGIISNLKLEEDMPITDQCGDCRRCIEACPTGALVAPYQLDSRKCLGYITLSKGYIDEDYRKKMGLRLWGCDSCQSVCPHNQRAQVVDHQEFRPQLLDAYPELIPLLTLSNREYQEQFMITPMNWRGKRPIQRNAAIILGNLGDRRAIPDLVEALEDPKPIVRAHAAWALSQIKDQSIIDDLERCLLKERDSKVIAEIEDALERLKESSG